MTLLHGDFYKKNIELIGTPDAARATVAADRVLRSAVLDNAALNRVNAEPAKSVPADLDSHIRPVNDPVRHPSALVLVVRAFSGTETKLQALCAVEGLTFWGEAIAQVIEFCAENQDLADLDSLKARAPQALLRNVGGARDSGVRSFGSTLTPLSPHAMAFVEAVARRERVGRAVAATLILHRNIALALAAFTADRGRA